MLLGTKLLQAATKSAYPQSWACLPLRHADSLCRRAPGSPAEVSPGGRRHAVLASTSNLAETSCRLGAKIIKPGSALFIRPKFPWPEGASKSASTNRKAGAGGPGSHSWEETAGALGRERRGEGRGHGAGFLNWFHSFWGRGHFWGFQGETLTRCLHTSALPIPPLFPALSKFGNTFGHVGALRRHRRGHSLQISGHRAAVEGSPEIKAGAVQPCITLCPEGHPQGGGGPAGADRAREEGAGILQRGAAGSRLPRPRPLLRLPPAPPLQFWGVCAPTFSSQMLLRDRVRRGFWLCRAGLEFEDAYCREGGGDHERGSVATSKGAGCALRAQD